MAERQLHRPAAHVPGQRRCTRSSCRASPICARIPPGAGWDGTWPSRESRRCSSKSSDAAAGSAGSLRTTSMLLDHDVLIDAGTGVGDLTLTELKQIDHIFVTHSHLDHVVSIPFLVDTVGGMRDSPITRARDRGNARHPQEAPVQLEDLAGLRRDPESRRSAVPALRELPHGRHVTLRGRQHPPLPANHVVPAVGFHLDSGEGEPGVHRRHHDQRCALGRGQPDREPALSDHRDRVLERRARAGDRIQAS